MENLLPQNNSNRLSLTGCFLCVISGSFVLQPLDLRIPSGIPFSGVLMCLFILMCIVSVAIAVLGKRCRSSTWPEINLTGSLAVCVFFSVWLSVEWLDSLEIRNGFAMAVYLVFFGLVVSTLWSLGDLTAAWYSLLVATLIISSVGAWRFVNGYHGPASEYTGGLVANLSGGYPVYFGVSYTPSTRNSDVLYVATPLLFSLACFSHNVRSNVRWALLAVPASIPVVLSLSRGGWLAIAAAFLFLFAKHLRFLFLTIIFGLGVLAAGSISEGPSGRLVRGVYSGALSLIDPDSAVVAAGGSNIANYSNAERTHILRQGIEALLAKPFGSGAVLISEGGSADMHLRVVHHENFYLDLGVMFGVFAPALIATVLILPVIRSIRLAQRECPGLFWVGAAFCIFLAVYCLFNSVMDFSFFWYLAAISAATVSAFALDDQASDGAKA